MEKKLYRCTLTLALLMLLPHNLAADQSPHLISFFMVPCALNAACAKKFPHDSLKEILGSHTDIAHEIMKKHATSPLVQGLYVNYLGYITYSDYNGQILLPHREQSPSLTVVVTESIYPVILQGKTVHHFEVPQEHAADFYRYVLTEVASDKSVPQKKWQWTVSKLPRPGSSRVPLNALIIMAHARDIEIPQGTFPALPGPHLMLPDVYVHSKMDTPFCVMKFLKINRFFEPLTVPKEYKPQSHAYVVLS